MTFAVGSNSSGGLSAFEDEACLLRNAETYTYDQDYGLSGCKAYDSGLDPYCAVMTMSRLNYFIRHSCFLYCEVEWYFLTVLCQY